MMKRQCSQIYESNLLFYFQFLHFFTTSENTTFTLGRMSLHVTKEDIGALLRVRMSSSPHVIREDSITGIVEVMQNLLSEMENIIRDM